MYHASLNILAQPRLSKTVQDVFYTFHPHIDHRYDTHHQYFQFSRKSRTGTNYIFANALTYWTLRWEVKVSRRLTIANYEEVTQPN